MSYLNPHSTGPDFCVDLMPLLQLRADRPGPDLVEAATIAQASGADAISLVAEEVAPDLLAAIASALVIKLQLRILIGSTRLEELISVQPHRICMTLDGGSAAIAQQLNAHGIQSAFAIKTNLGQVRAAHAAGACAIELDASQYGASANADHVDDALALLVACAAEATRLGMQVQVAHGLDLANAGRLASLEDVTQIQVGQALLVRAIAVGWRIAVGEMKARLSQARRQDRA